ncbi:arylsulfatase [Sorangium sp. So ce887]|uniref:arylsulfatase n=1 Tax=Sorangium sp. So ce887 TaxID=3133324 RepID=UPI003F5EEC4F
MSLYLGRACIVGTVALGTLTRPACLSDEGTATSTSGGGTASQTGGTAETSGGTAGTGGSAAARANILFILADDLGYSDIGAFGGEIATPNLDTLAAEGRILADHKSTPTCSPTRASLFSGTDHHLVGLGNMAEVMRPEQQGKPGYEGYLNEQSLSIAELLRDGGYRTYMAGKWHLGVEEIHGPKARGFESSFALLGGAGSHFAPVPGQPIPSDNVQYRDDGVLTTVPADFFSTTFYTDKLISYIDQHAGDGKPFFAYAAYTAPHWPLMAPPEYIDRYRGRYDEGYEAVRSARIARQKKLGIIPEAFEPAPRLPSTPDNPDWDDLDPEQKQVEARRMEIYAAMVEHLDYNIGRLIERLKEIGEYDNTLVFFQSDNGAEGGTFNFPDGPNTDNSLENLGKPLSNVTYGARWGEVGATPFRLWKAHTTEGGVTVPAIVRLPAQTAKQQAFRGLSHVSDVAPTFLAIAGIADPGSTYAGREVHPITGYSLLPVLEGLAQEVRPWARVLAEELFGDRYVLRGDHKLVWLEPPFGTADWALYDLSKDRAEQVDVSAAEPAIRAELEEEWEKYVVGTGVVLANPAP